MIIQVNISFGRDGKFITVIKTTGERAPGKGVKGRIWPATQFLKAAATKLLRYTRLVG